jgi:sugar phosphate isomerase/epimerase
MRVGVIGRAALQAHEVTAQTAAALRARGFTGCHWTLAQPITPEALDEGALRRVRDVLADGGVRVAQAVPRNVDLVSGDEALRRQAVRELELCCKATRLLDAASLYVRPGSLNPSGSWRPHPENTRLETLERLVQGLRQVAKAAEGEGVVLALEGAAVSPLDTPERVRDVIEAVGSPALRFCVDAVNFVRGLDELFNTTSLINRLYDLCGRYAVAVHAKDLTYENAATVKLSECIIGEGFVDMPLVLRRFQEVCPDGYVLIEHLPDEKVPAAKRGLDAALARAGLHWEE